MGQDDPLEFTSQPASLLSELQASDRPCLKSKVLRLERCSDEGMFCSLGGRGFDSRHSFGGSQPSLTTIPGDPTGTHVGREKVRLRNSLQG